MNAALNIAELLEELLKDRPGNTTLAEAFAGVHGCQAWDPEFLFAMAALRDRFDLLQKQIAEAPIKDRTRSLYGSATRALLQAMTPPNFQNQNLAYLAKQQQQIDILHTASEVLPDELVPDVPRLIRDRLEEKLGAIIEETKAADIDAELKRIVLSQLERILFAVRAYDHLGPDGAAKLFGAAVAELNRASGSAAAKSKPAKLVYRKVAAGVKAVGGALIFVGATVGAAHTAITDGRALLDIVTGDLPDDDTGQTQQGKESEAPK